LASDIIFFRGSFQMQNGIPPAPAAPPSSLAQAHSAKRLLPRDTTLGWRIAGWLLIAGTTLNVLVFVVEMIQEQARQNGSTTSTVVVIRIAAALVGCVLALICAIALLTNQPWARLATMILVGLGALGALFASALLNERDLPMRSRAFVMVLVVWMLVGWYMLIDRPTKPSKIAVGTAMVGAMLIMTLVRLVASISASL
jgi:hypothetical protein